MDVMTTQAVLIVRECAAKSGYLLTPEMTTVLAIRYVSEVMRAIIQKPESAKAMPTIEFLWPEGSKK